MDLMKGLEKFLRFINDNWTLILAILGLGYAVYYKITSFIKLSKEEKIKCIMDSLDQIILDLMSSAEFYWANYGKSGELKRSQVIREIYDKYPILSEYCDQEELIKRIDELIEKYKPVMDCIINGKTPEGESVETTVLGTLSDIAEDGTLIINPNNNVKIDEESETTEGE